MKLVHKSHQANDRAVMKAYSMPIRETDEAACVVWLMRRIGMIHGVQ